MIHHHVVDEKYSGLSQEWSQFLKPFDSDKISIEIQYDDVHPVFIDAEKRKFKIDFENDRANYAKFKSGRNSEPLSRALGAGKMGSRVLDLSAGLGIDAVFLAQLGFQVTAVERNPFIFLALKNALHHLTAAYRDNLKFIFSEAQNFLENNQEFFDVAYFDPMFPTKVKSALPRQEMVFFKNLVGADDDAFSLIEQVQKSKKFKRLVVKRPLTAEAFAKPSGCIKGKIIRYDIYSN